MSSQKEKMQAVEYSLQVLKKQLAEVNSKLNVESDTEVQYKPELVAKRNEIIRAIESGEKLLRAYK